MKFTDLQLASEIQEGIASLGFEEATPIQAQAIPHILDKRDIIACAQTGTGKTAAYLLPVMHQLVGKTSDRPRVLILCPTRELAEQIDRHAEGLSYFAGLSSMAMFGGKDSDSWDRHKVALRRGVDILIATPGRLIAYINLGMVNFTGIETVVLDEADKMLDMGFHPDILRILKEVPDARQTLMFSATMPPKIRRLAQEIMKEPVEINLNLAKPAAGIEQSVYFVHDEQKIPVLEHLLRERKVESMIIFASSKASVDRIHRKLERLNYGVRAMHSDKSQEERTETLREFRNRQFPIIIGTDVLARGIDIDNLSHVVNYDCPMDAEDYVHRVGRTARASATGQAITLVNPKDMYRLRQIERLIGYEITRMPVPPELGETPDMNAPAERSGRGGRPDKRRGGSDHRGGSPDGQGANRNRNRGGNRSGTSGEHKPQPQPVQEGAVQTATGEAAARKRKKRRKPRPKNGSGPAATPPQTPQT
ncbi:MAG: DEAD/DEAH box helicase [Bacteroidia bacterium]|nr:DEAD/DEAH box helicase [Bacteroidia bacterium]